MDEFKYYRFAQVNEEDIAILDEEEKGEEKVESKEDARDDEKEEVENV